MFLCSNKEVAKANYDLHEPHCKRFLCKCPDCNDTVPRDQLEEHKTEQHAQVTTTHSTLVNILIYTLFYKLLALYVTHTHKNKISDAFSY